MKLKELCILDVACCQQKMTIAEAARLMRQHHTGDLIVTELRDGANEPVGILTDRDIVMEVIAKERDPARVHVSEVMAAPIVIASGSEDVTTAIERMRVHGVRRLPIVDDAGGLLGIVTLDDLYRVLAEQTTALTEVVNKEQVREQRGRR